MVNSQDVADKCTVLHTVEILRSDTVLNEKISQDGISADTYRSVIESGLKTNSVTHNGPGPVTSSTLRKVASAFPSLRRVMIVSVALSNTSRKIGWNGLA